jgi:hypothetical protein
MAGVTCRTNTDCRLFSDYCTGCDCRALGAGEVDPVCSGPGVRCFADPCLKQNAVCQAGRCAVAPGTSACAQRTQGGPTSCKPLDVWSKDASQDCVASGLVLGEVALRGDCGGGATQFVDYTCCASAAPATITVDGCSWPAALAANDATSGQCRGAARAVLSCTNADGGEGTCVTSDAACDTSGTNVAGPFTCQNHCSPSEFGIACGHVGVSSDPEVTPPPTCRAVIPTPAGVVFYCCPCGA